MKDGRLKQVVKWLSCIALFTLHSSLFTLSLVLKVT